MSTVATPRPNPNARCRAATRLPLAALPLLALAGCAETPPAPATASAGPPRACQLQLLADLPTGPAANAILVPVSIDGKPTLMTLDLDGNSTYVFKQAMQRDGIAQLADKPSQWATGVKSFRIGNIELNNLAVSIVDYDNYRFHTRYRNVFPSGWGGGLSGFVLSRYDIDFDLGHGRVRLFQPNTCHGPIQYWSGPLVSVPFKFAATPRWMQGSGVLYYYVKVPILIDGHEALATFDPSGENFMNGFPLPAFGIHRDDPAVTKIVDPNDPHPQRDSQYRAVIPRVTLGDAVMTNVPVIIGGEDIVDPPLLELGMDFLRRNRVYIAWADHMVYFTPYAAMP